jgi:hypothetical protein
MRRLFAIVAAISFTLCLATVACLVRSYYVRDSWHFGLDGGNSHTAQSILGRVHFVSTLSGSRVSSETSYSSDRLSTNAIWGGGMSGYPVKVERHFGCVFQRYSKYHMPMSDGGMGHTSQHQLVVIPYWWMVLLFAVLPTAYLMHNKIIHRICQTARALTNR